MIAGAAIAALALIGFVGAPRTSEQRADATRDVSAVTGPVGGPEALPTPVAARTIYPYSIVPGGVLTPAEVERAMAQDPVVASHYAGLNPRALRVVRLLEPRDAYVSYRIGNEVFWTTRKLRVKAGETVLTDGRITVRARCGNQVADAPLGPASPAEPSAEVFDAEVPTALAGGVTASDGATALSGGSAPSAQNEWASAAGSSHPRGTTLWAGSGPRDSGSGSHVPSSGPDGDPSFSPGPFPNPGPPVNPEPPPTSGPPPNPGPPTIGPPPLPSPNPPGPTADPDPGPDPHPGPKDGPRSDPDPGPDPRRDPRPGPPPSSDPNEDPVPVPEPTTLVLVGIGAGGALIRHLRTRRPSRH